MSLSLGQLEAMIDALVMAIGSATLSVQFGDRRVQYRSIAEMEQALTRLRAEREILLAGSVPVVRSSFASYRAS